MKLLRLPLACTALVCSTAFAASIPADSTITAATIYPDRAVVTRTATTLVVPAGTTEITFAQLPAALLDESVQVTAKGAVPATLLDIVTRIAYVTTEPDARIKALEDQLLALRREERALNDQATVLESQRALLTSIEKVSTTPVTWVPGAYLAAAASQGSPSASFMDREMRRLARSISFSTTETSSPT